MKSNKKSIIVLYHSRCADGTGAAWSAWRKFGKKAEYHPIEPREQLKTLPHNKEIYLLDNSYSAEYLRKLMRAGNRITIIDHHKTSEQDIQFAQNGVFDLNHSAAVLAWEYFFPGKPIPKLLLHIEDFDLWKFDLADTKKVSAFFGWGGFEILQFDKIMKQFSATKTRVKVLEQGKLLLDFENYLVERLIKNAELVSLEGYKVLAVNSPILNSQIGFRLWHIKGPFSVVWHERNGKRYYSMRCNKDGKFDVSKIAKHFPEGGGHRAAAAFSLSITKPFPWKVVGTR